MGKKNRRRNRGGGGGGGHSATAAQRGMAHSNKDKKKNSLLLDPGAINNPYVVGRSNFSNLVRWPNDGIEQERQKNVRGENEVFNVDNSNDPETLALKELLGGYSLSESPLNELVPEGRGFIVNLPFMFQSNAAKEQADESFAKKHLIDAYKQKNVDAIELLREINCDKSIYKASRDPTRFPDFRTMIVPLLQKNLASDSNIELLFGKVGHVRHFLLDVGALLAEPPPPNSPAGADLARFLYKEHSKAPLAPKVCAECDSVSDGVKDYPKCNACKTVHYCSRECQAKHWLIHKPDCLRAQGKDVPASVIAKSEKKRKKKEDLENQLRMQEMEQQKDEFLQYVEGFFNESPTRCDSFAHDCRGQKRRVYVPSVFADQIITAVATTIVGLKKNETLSLGMYPDGIDDTKYGFRGLDLFDPSNSSARILVLFERLFSRGGSGEGAGLHIDGIFVVDKVIRSKAKWRLIEEPKNLYDSNQNRRDRLVTYLNKAKMEAKGFSAQSNVDFGIHNPGDPILSATETQFGPLLNLHRIQNNL